MKYYSFDKFGFYNGSRNAQINPENKGKFLGCAKNETPKKPLTALLDKVNYWNSSKWALVDDYRGKQIWSTNEPGKNGLVGANNEIPDGWTLLEYIKNNKWNGSKWVVDTSQKQEILEQILEKINADTAAKIYAGIDYDDVQFYLTAENQRNFAELDRNRADLIYPYTVWCGDGEAQLQDADEVHTFYRLGYHHISIQLEAGKQAKKDARSKTTAELLELLNLNPNN